MDQAVEHLSTKLKALSSNPRTATTKMVALGEVLVWKQLWKDKIICNLFCKSHPDHIKHITVYPYAPLNVIHIYCSHPLVSWGPCEPKSVDAPVLMQAMHIFPDTSKRSLDYLRDLKHCKC
jgi:hypothetical protein